MRLRLYIQSISDLITNSSTEVFCRLTVDKKDIMESIESYLSTITGDDYSIRSEYDSDKPYIDFWVEMGAFNDAESIPTLFTAMLKELLINRGLTYDVDFTIDENIEL